MTNKQFSRRDFLKTAAATTGALAVGALPDLSRITALAADQITINYGCTWELAFQPTQEAFDAAYTAKHPNVTIKKIYNTWADHQAIVLTWAAAGQLPDFLYVHGTRAVPWSKGNILMSLDKYIAADTGFDIAGVFQEALRLYKVDGTQWAIPYDHGPILLGYNIDMFDKMKMKYPTADWTQDDLATAMKALSIPGKQWGFDSVSLGNESAPAHLGPYGGATFNDAEDGLLLDTDGSRAGLNFWFDLMHKDHAVADQAESTAAAGGSDARMSGLFGMFRIATWDVPTFHDLATFKYDVAPWPKGPKGYKTGSFGSGFGGTATTKVGDAVWAYMSEYLSKDGMEFMWAKSGRGSPARESAYQAFLDAPIVPKGSKYFLDAMKSYAVTGHPYLTVKGPEVLTVITDNVTLLSTGDITVDQFITKVNEQAKPIFDRK